MDAYKYQETMANIRHYSNVRFAMLTVFVAITGGLLSVAYSPTITVSTTLWSVNLLNLAGMWVALVFLVFELALNIYLAGLWATLGADAHRFRKPVLLWAVRVAALSLPVLTFIYWLLVHCPGA
jgi:hypothetical protein